MNSSKHTAAEIRSIAIGLIATLAATTVFWTTSWDLSLQRIFYTRTLRHWSLAALPFWRALHDYGTWPGIGLIVAAGVGLAVGGRWRNPSLFVLLVAILGCGIVTNTLGKALCGRPRPDAVTSFGGALAFQRPCELAMPGQGYSFLCGHASMGFLFCALFFVTRGWLRWVSLLGGLGFGILLGIGRMAGGTHWASDVLLDATLMLTIAVWLAPIARDGLRLSVAGWVGVGVVALVLLRFGTPVHKEQSFALPATTRELVIDAATQDVRVVQGVPGRISITVDGAGLPGAGVRNELRGSGPALELRSRLTGLYWNVRHQIVVTVPAGVRVLVRAAANAGSRSDVSREDANARREAARRGRYSTRVTIISSILSSRLRVRRLHFVRTSGS